MELKRTEKVRRLLVITYHFPPDGAIGGQRWAGLSKYLARLGWEVHVVTAAPGPENPTPGVYRHFCSRRRTLNDAYNDLARRLREASVGTRDIDGEAPTRALSPWAVGPLAALRRIVGSAMYLPDDGRGWVSRAAGIARTLLRESEFEFVITSGPPHSTHFAGLAATWGRGVPVWIDMRDPWLLGYAPAPTDDWVLRGERMILRRLEHLVLSRATKVIANTPRFASVISTNKSGVDVTCIPNGVDLEQVRPRDANTVELGLISYVGTLYFGRNLSSLCAAMRQLLDARPELAATLRLHIAGPIESPHRRQLEADIAASRLTSIVTVHGLLARADALALTSRSALALVLAQGQPMQVPAKLYESVALGVPTLVIAETNSASAREARRVGAMTLEGADVDGLRSLLENIVTGNIPTMFEPQAPIAYDHLAREWDQLLRGSLKLGYLSVEQPDVSLTGRV